MTCLLLAALALQETEPWLGLTAEQAVRLGRDTFVERYTAAHGDSTAAMVGAQTAFGAALRAVNDAWLAKQPEAARDLAEDLRPLLADFQELCFDAGVRMTGGGTIWNPVYAGTAADVEEAVAVALGRSAPGKPVAQAEAWKALERLEARIRRDAKEMDEIGPEGTKPSEAALAKAAAAKGLMAPVIDLARTLRPDRRTGVFEFLRDAAQTPVSMSGGD